MSKKKKNKKKKNNIGDYQSMSKKKLDKKLKKAIKEIEISQIKIMEADKKANKKERKKINKKEKEFFTDMEGLKVRKKIAKDWEENGFLDLLLRLFKEVIPQIKMIAKMVCKLILSFLALESIKTKIKPKTLKKIITVFDIALSL